MFRKVKWKTKLKKNNFSVSLKGCRKVTSSGGYVNLETRSNMNLKAAVYDYEVAMRKYGMVKRRVCLLFEKNSRLRE